MLVSIAFNWIVGVLIYNVRSQSRFFLSFGVVLNLALLLHYKYSNFFIENFNKTIGVIFDVNFNFSNVLMPLGISFFTFHSISYLIDIYRNQSKPMANPLDVGLYISLFPQLIAGPIVRYHDISAQIDARTNSWNRFSSGVERFVFGLGKKVLLANSFGNIANIVFNTGVHELTLISSWLGMICYSLQIYYDFSGYSDMAIGLGRMFGFELLENFNYPYMATSIRDFWKRWHLSLSAWFRDYLYIPLGGSRMSSARTRMNLFVVFLLCGLWHGASWNFVIWGCLHGCFLVLERGKFGSLLKILPPFVGRFYSIMVVMFAWVFFRSDSAIYAAEYMCSLLGFFHGGTFSPGLELQLTNQFYLKFIMGIILSTPILTFLSSDWNTRKYPIPSPLLKTLVPEAFSTFSRLNLLFCRAICVVTVFFLSISELAITTFNPFIYFRF